MGNEVDMLISISLIFSLILIGHKMIQRKKIDNKIISLASEPETCTDKYR